MPSRKTTIRLAAVLILAAVLGQPAGAGAQCVIANTDTGSGTQFGMAFMYVNKTLSNDYFCNLTMSMNVIDCFPTAGGTTTSVLSASAYDTAVSPSCAWACICGTVVTDNSDNLPVELMEFSVEDEGGQDADTADGEGSAARGGAAGDG